MRHDHYFFPGDPVINRKLDLLLDLVRDVLVRETRILNKVEIIMATQAEILADLAAANEQLDALLVSNAAIRNDIEHLNDLIESGASLDELKLASAALLAKATAAAGEVAATDDMTPAP